MLGAVLASALAGGAARADCQYGDALQAERSEVRRPDGQLVMCVEGRWICDSDILAVITVEKARLWTDCCGSADETEYVKAACDQKAVCSAPPARSWAGAEADPARRQHLWVSYHCAIGSKDLPTSHVATQAEEDAPLRLSCKDFTYR